MNAFCSNDYITTKSPPIHDSPIVSSYVASASYTRVRWSPTDI